MLDKVGELGVIEDVILRGNLLDSLVVLMVKLLVLRCKVLIV